MKLVIKLQYLALFFLVFSMCNTLNGQSPYILPGTLSDEVADRWDILYDFEHEVFASQRNTSRLELSNRAYSILKSKKHVSSLDMFDIQYILNDNNEYSSYFQNSGNTNTSKKVYDSTGVFYYTDEIEEVNAGSKAQYQKPILKYFYKLKANFFEVNKDGFSLRANPILKITYGNAVDDPNIIFQNTRGAEVRGLIDNKIYFYTSILENQARFNNYVERRIVETDAIPGNGYFKPFNSGVIDNLSGSDYLNAQGYVGINATKSVAIEFGHGKHFIGNGIRSMLISDYGNNYFYLKFNTRIWKLHYQNLFMELAPISARQNPRDRLLPKKYVANHYLSYKPSKNIELGIFETVIFSRENHFEFQYLNPIVLYRTVEQFLDSPDNVLIGFNGKWNIKNRFQLYGQLMLDEFKLGMLREANGWWANKYSIQLGAKYINVGGIDHLDAQLEYNRVRPFTYSHRDSLINFPNISTASYSNYNQPLAHPLGANFSEVIFDLRYRPTAKLSFQSRVILAGYGENPEGQNLGSDILQITTTREMEFGNEVGQGVKTDLLSVGLDVSYQIYHNYFIDFNMLYRKADSELDSRDLNTTYVGGGVRVNLGNIRLEY